MLLPSSPSSFFKESWALYQTCLKDKKRDQDQALRDLVAKTPEHQAELVDAVSAQLALPENHSQQRVALFRFLEALAPILPPALCTKALGCLFEAIEKRARVMNETDGALLAARALVARAPDCLEETLVPLVTRALSSTHAQSRYFAVTALGAFVHQVPLEPRVRAKLDAMAQKDPNAFVRLYAEGTLTRWGSYAPSCFMSPSQSF